MSEHKLSVWLLPHVAGVTPMAAVFLTVLWTPAVWHNAIWDLYTRPYLFKCSLTVDARSS